MARSVAIRWSKLPLQKTFVASLLLLAACVSGSVFAFSRVAEAARWIKHTDAVRIELTRLGATLVDAETGERGYLATGEPIFLEPYDRALGTWRSSFDTLHSLTDDNPTQQRRLSELHRLIERELEELKNAMDASKRGVHGVELAPLVADGKRTMDAIRAALSEMDMAEERLDEKRSRASLRSERILLGMLLATAVCLTVTTTTAWATRKATQIREEAARRLAESQRLFAALVENLPELAWTALPHGQVDLYNRQWFDYTDTTFEDMQGSGWEKVHDPEMVPKVADAWKRALATGEPFEMEFPLRRGSDGSFRWFLTRAHPLRNDAGNVVRWFGTNVDIDEIRSQREFQERFAAILGHDLRNPLASVDMATGLLQQRAKKINDEQAMRILDRVASSSRRMSRMVEQILDLTRSRLRGGLEVHRAPMDLCATMTSIADELRVAYPGRTIALHCPPIVGAWDRDRLEQVFSNLIGNAIHHGLASEPVIVEGRVEDDGVVVSVQNRGPAIPEELLARIFDPFRRGSRDSRAAQTAGLGLGLYVSRAIVVAHGGQLEAESNADWTTFQVTLPRTIDAAEDAGGEAKP